MESTKIGVKIGYL